MEAAKSIMRSSGNMKQWTGSYPSEEIIKADMKKNGAYLLIDNNTIVAYFAFLPSPEPTYDKIYNGNWIDNTQPYYVVHRIASEPHTHQIFNDIMQFCFSVTNNIRIDTHRDNTIMQHVMQKYGFTYCGIIHIANGDERVAFQKIVE